MLLLVFLLYKVSRKHKKVNQMYEFINGAVALARECESFSVN